MFIRNIRSFNKALGNGYHDDAKLGTPLNETLIKQISDMKKELKIKNPELL